MSIEFGLSRLRAYSNGIGSGVAVTTNLSGSAAVATGSVWIGGSEVQVTAANINIASGASVNTGGMKIYAYLAAGQSSTASLGFLTANAPAYTNPDGTAIAIISVGAFGTGTGIYVESSTSGLTGMKPFGRAMNVAVNINYDTAQARGGTLVFANDLKLFNGSVEGTLEHAEISGANLAHILGGTWASGGAGSGTLTVSATNSPLSFMIESQQITDGVTSTIRINKCYSNQITMNMDRENYLIPSLGFQAIANHEGDMFTWQI